MIWESVGACSAVYRQLAAVRRVAREGNLGSRAEELNSVRALRLPFEPSPHFACLRDFLSNSDFYEPSICRRVGMTGLSDFLSGDRTRITLSGESDRLGVLIRFAAGLG